MPDRGDQSQVESLDKHPGFHRPIIAARVDSVSPLSVCSIELRA
jgi:hypothetical protein